MRTITITLDFGGVSWEKTYIDGEIGDGTDYTIEEWEALSDEDRILNALAWSGLVLRYTKQDAPKEGETN
jgi:hypothetical protein